MALVVSDAVSTHMPRGDCVTRPQQRATTGACDVPIVQRLCARDRFMVCEMRAEWKSIGHASVLQQVTTAAGYLLYVGCKNAKVRA